MKDDMEFKQVQWKSAGLNRKWRSKKTALDHAIERGVQDSLKAFEDTKRTNQVIVGYRPD